MNPAEVSARLWIKSCFAASIINIGKSCLPRTAVMVYAQKGYWTEILFSALQGKAMAIFLSLSFGAPSLYLQSDISC